MTDIEKAVSKWLPEVWFYCSSHPCPLATPELGFRLLEAMAAHVWNIFIQHTKDGWTVGIYVHQHASIARPKVRDEPNLLTAIIKAAAALANKE